MKKSIINSLKAMGLVAFAATFTSNAQAQCNELFISEYIEGWSNNKALEIYNPTGASVDLSDYRLERYANGATAAQDNQKVDLSGMLESDSVVVVVLDKQDPDGVDFEAPVWDELAEAADLWVCPVYDENNTMYFNGNDAMVLRKISTNTVVDIFGKIGEDPGTTGWAEMTQNHTLVRKPEVLQGDTDALDDFLVVDEWDGMLWSNDSLNYTLDQVFLTLGFHMCDCGTTSLSDVAMNPEVQVYPNPASGDVLWIQGGATVREVVMHNLAGQAVRAERVAESSAVEFNLNGLQPGMYLMEVRFANGQRTTRRVVRN
ncbi:MAG: lamin tail domain-containing protein [Flavobacteriales bacterium]